MVVMRTRLSARQQHRKKPCGLLRRKEKQVCDYFSAPFNLLHPEQSGNGLCPNITRSLTRLIISLVAYVEDVEGFQFTFASSKKAKPSSGEEVSVPEPIVEEPVQQQSPKRGRPPKTKSSKASGGEDAGVNGAASGKPSRGRPKRVSTELQTEPEINHRSTRARDEEAPFPMEMSRKKGRPSKSKADDASGFISPEPTQTGTSKIALPLADTPVIRRNKEMREERAGKGQRRSSLGMRGRRASSLIDSGASNGGEILPQKSPSPETERGADTFRTAVPHKEVDTSDFYKHIASEGLSEPRRMKQLLTWCATRALGDKPSGSRSDDDNARLAGELAGNLEFGMEKS